MARLEATLDLRCLLAGSTVMNVDPYGEREVPFHVLLEGECQLELSGTLYPMRAGDVFIIPSGERHRIITGGGGTTVQTRKREGSTFGLVTSDTDAEGNNPVIDLFCGHYKVSAGSGSLLFGSLPTPTQASLFASEEGASTLTQLSSLMRAEAERDGPGSAAILSAFCTVLIALVLRTSPDGGGRDQLWTAVADPRMGRVVWEIVQRPGDDWSVERLCRMTNFSRATFYRRFRAVTGMTFVEFLTKARLMRAADELVGSDATVARVAALVGYRSESAFTRVFAAAMGQTPARFRRSQSETAKG